MSEHTGPDDFVIWKRRKLSDANLRGRLYGRCIKAGVERWPKIFQNLRSTRQTTLEQFYPRGTVCAWMGNTEDVAEAHYVQELREFRKQASEQPTTATTLNSESVHYPGKKQPNPTRKGQEVGRTGANPKFEPPVRPKQNALRFPVSSGNSQGLVTGSARGKTEEDGNRTHQ